METANVLVLCAKTVTPADAASARGCGMVASRGWARQIGGTQYRVGVKAGLCRHGRVWKGRGDVYTGSKAPAVRRSKRGQWTCFPFCSHLEHGMESPRGLVAPGQFHPGFGTMRPGGDRCSRGRGGTAAVSTSFTGPRLGGDPTRQPLPTRGTWLFVLNTRRNLASQL